MILAQIYGKIKKPGGGGVGGSSSTGLGFGFWKVAGLAGNEYISFFFFFGSYRINFSNPLLMPQFRKTRPGLTNLFELSAHYFVKKFCLTHLAIG